MNITKWLLLIFGLLVLAAGLDLAYYYPQLPERVATHFNIEGQPDDWSSKGMFLMIYGLLLVIMTLIFPGSLLLMPVFPKSWINLPHKEYWFAPERIQYAQDVLGRFVMCFGIATLGFLLATLHDTMLTNLTPRPHLADWFWVAFGIYIAVDLVITVWVYFAFRLPKYRA